MNIFFYLKVGRWISQTQQKVSESYHKERLKNNSHLKFGSILLHVNGFSVQIVAHHFISLLYPRTSFSAPFKGRPPDSELPNPPSDADDSDTAEDCFRLRKSRSRSKDRSKKISARSISRDSR